MVAISLYRGNLHRVPNVSRRWLMPTRKISLKDFKILIDRRSKALSRLQSSSSTTTSSDVNPNPNSETTVKEEEEAEAEDNVVADSDTEPPQLDPLEEKKESLPPEVEDEKRSEGRDGSVKPVDGPDGDPDGKIAVAEDAIDAAEALQDEKPVAQENPNTEIRNKTDALTAKELRKKEIEEKLQTLNSKKHNLVQVLKQILHTEEELKRRNNTQGGTVRSSVPLQGDASNDSGSITRHTTPRMGTEGNLGGDTEAGEADEVSKDNMHSRHLLRTSSASPSSESPHRRPAYFQHTAVPHHSRASVAVSGSPSRFAPPGHGTPANLPTVSVSGTNYIASSPSPAASGGTSAFRDARQPSPWN